MSHLNYQQVIDLTVEKLPKIGASLGLQIVAITKHAPSINTTDAATIASGKVPANFTDKQAQQLVDWLDLDLQSPPQSPKEEEQKPEKVSPEAKKAGTPIDGRRDPLKRKIPQKGHNLTQPKTVIDEKVVPETTFDIPDTVTILLRLVIKGVFSHYDKSVANITEVYRKTIYGWPILHNIPDYSYYHTSIWIAACFADPDVRLFQVMAFYLLFLLPDKVKPGVIPIEILIGLLTYAQDAKISEDILLGWLNQLKIPLPEGITREDITKATTELLKNANTFRATLDT
ncbi:MAG: hypothetical protein OXR68_06605 [Alphaproteobacteria bacterium]|nr:hypothetical protein [Alphaproteobacteria bacterium]MDD9920274.1 hypothetical protein [Alphaproteobacteria bacterium]